jgi:hypothetical protein
MEDMIAKAANRDNKAQIRLASIGDLILSNAPLGSLEVLHDALLDRGWGKPDKTHHHDGDIRQHIISDRPLTPDEWTAKYCRA